MKSVRTAFAAIVFVMAAVIVTYGATTKVTQASISIKDYSYGVPGRLYEPKFSSGSYTEIESIDWATLPEKPGHRVTVVVYLKPKEGFAFNTTGKNKTQVTVSGGNLSKYSVLSSQQIKAYITYLPRVTLAPVELSSMYLEEDGFTLCWDKVEYAPAYRIKLSGAENKSLVVAGKTSCNLSGFVTNDLSETHIQIQATPKTDAQKQYLKESEWTDFTEGILPDERNTVSGVFEGTASKGTLRLCTDVDTEDGTRYYATGWQFLGAWYLFDKNGYAKTGFQESNGKVYYLDVNTAQMLTDWQLIDGVWYYFNYPNGDMAISKWIQTSPSGKWYYVGADGKMLANTTTPDGYRVGADGAWIP